jgi:hypothetical protein
MTHFTQTALQSLRNPATSSLDHVSTLELAQALLERLTITDHDWHRLKANRTARAREQSAAALLFLLKEQPQEALVRLQQAVGWLDRSVSAPACPSHNHQTPPSRAKGST